MALTNLFGASLSGVDALAVQLEIDVAQGTPAFVIVGLPDTAVKESRDRVKRAIKNAGYRFPRDRITVNLAPAEQKKSGGLDLPMALGILASAGDFDAKKLNGVAAIGELALSGEVRPCHEILSVAEVLAKRDDIETLIVPWESRQEAALVAGATQVFGVRDLCDAVGLLTNKGETFPVEIDTELYFSKLQTHRVPDIAEVRGQTLAKRALLVAAAGRHGLLFRGPPGAGKSMLAERLAGLLPPMTLAESLEVTKIYAACGMLDSGQKLVTVRPFRAPHHSISDAGLVGGGVGPRPGEVSLAHRGVLFLDELPEYKRHVLEQLREPMEKRTIVISRARSTARFPADFQFIAAMNPCQCGYWGDQRRRCQCSSAQVARYQNRLSGPLLDRIDLHVDIEALSFDELFSREFEPGLNTAQAQNLVIEAQQRQFTRLGPGRCNSSMSSAEVEKFVELSKSARSLMRHACERLGLSARRLMRIRRVARTIADLNGEAGVTPEHIAEAMSWRSRLELVT